MHLARVVVPPGACCPERPLLHAHDDRDDARDLEAGRGQYSRRPIDRWVALPALGDDRHNIGSRTLTRSMLLAFSVLLGSSCANFPVEPYGRDTWVVNVDSASGAKARRVAFQRANEHCRSLGLQMVPDSEQTSLSPNPWTGAPMQEIQFVFRCLSDADPGNVRPAMRPNPSAVIEDRR